MRIMIKGGVWKNTEDEILKAAVMKYGKNQWARIASLMPRKSSKQCKARWYEWLDPSIKKTEWTREEEEKLLHLAKLMPTQWRTIAPIVGRTAAQCLMHYEKLLDQAQDRGDDYDPKDDPRRLRPGEIDPNPEIKPARPDPIDMDEDEKEMLSEARARLANTRGKKAKRKAREKQLIEAKRLATLQKRRELRAAGIEFKRRNSKKRRKYIDYNNEIPFQKNVPAGFYDVGDEDEDAKGNKKTIKFQVQEQCKQEARRRDVDEKRARKNDERRLAKLKKMNLPQHVANVAKKNDPSLHFRRSTLSLPAPQVTDGELEAIVKAGQAGLEDVTGGSAATRALVADYAATPAATPMRTPRTPSHADPILEEARNAIARNNMATPLLGGETPVLKGGTGFDGIEPNTPSIRTPSSLASMTPGHGATPSRTPGAGSVAGSTGSVTPMHDGLAINAGENMAESNPRAAREFEKQRRQSLRKGLAGIPEPQYEYGVELPADEGEEKADAVDQMEEDAADVDMRKIKAQAAARAEALRKRSAVLKRQLPRPSAIHKDMLGKSEGPERLVGRIMLKLMKYDHAKFPVENPSKKRKKKRRRKVPQLEPFSDKELRTAKALIAAETEKGGSSATPANAALFNEEWDKLFRSRVFMPARNCFENSADLSKAELLEATHHDFERLVKRMQKESSKATKLEQKLNIVLKGHRQMRQGLLKKVNAAQKKQTDVRNEKNCFLKLQWNEERALPQRMGRAQGLLRKEEERGRSLQKRYKSLEREHRTLWVESQKIQAQ